MPAASAVSTLKGNIATLSCAYLLWHLIIGYLVHADIGSSTGTVACSGRGPTSDALRRLSRQATTPSVVVCINRASQLPQFWKPTNKTILLALNDKPWTPKEAALAKSAAHKALDELVDFYMSISRHRLMDLGTDAASSLMDYCFGSASDAELHRKACQGANHVLQILLQDKTKSGNDDAFDWSSMTCEHTHTKTKYLSFLYYLSRPGQLPNDPHVQRLLDRLTALMQYTLDDCRTVDNYLDLGSTWQRDLATLRTPRLQIRHYVHKSNVATELHNIPGIRLNPAFEWELDLFTATLYKYLAKYRYINARDVKDGFDNDQAAHHAYLVTHAAYISTGYGRHSLDLSDTKHTSWLYKYIRENYFAVMETKDLDLDLLAEFIDILRTYGCDEENDVMVRYGTRFMLDKYAQEGYTWMKDKDLPGKERPSDYSLIHLPWTAASGLYGCGNGDPIVPGSFGYAFQESLKRTAEAERTQLRQKIRRHQ